MGRTWPAHWEPLKWDGGSNWAPMCKSLGFFWTLYCSIFCWVYQVINLWYQFPVFGVGEVEWRTLVETKNRSDMATWPTGLTSQTNHLMEGSSDHFPTWARYMRFPFVFQRVSKTEKIMMDGSCGLSPPLAPSGSRLAKSAHPKLQTVQILNLEKLHQISWAEHSRTIFFATLLWYYPQWFIYQPLPAPYHRALPRQPPGPLCKVFPVLKKDPCWGFMRIMY